jgi:hypothetical protein
MRAAERQLLEHRCRETFQRNLERLHFEISMQTPRRHLDVLVELLDLLLPGCGDSVLRQSFGEQLERAKLIISTRHNLRLCKDPK